MKRGHFFIVDVPTFEAVCALQDADAAASYLILAAGCTGSSRGTSWSREAIANRLAFNWRKASECLDRLVEKGHAKWLVEPSPRRRPRIELPLIETRYRPSQADQRLLDRIREGYQPDCPKEQRSAERLRHDGWATVKDSNWLAIDERPEQPAFLPLSLLGDEKGMPSDEASIIERIRKGRDAMAFHLLVHLYAAQDLANLGGVDSRMLQRRFTRTQAYETSSKTVWKFDACRDYMWWIATTTPHLHEGKEGDEPAKQYFERVRLLEDAGAIEWLIALAEDQEPNANIIYPVAIERHGKLVMDEPETLTGQFATAATTAIAMREEPASEWFQPREYLLSADRLYREAALIGIPRLRARPRTGNVARWQAERREVCEDWIDYFRGVLIEYHSDQLEALDRERSRHQLGINSASTGNQLDLNDSGESPMHEPALRAVASGGQRP